MDGYVTYQGVLTAIPLGIGVMSLILGDNWGWYFIGAAILMAGLFIYWTKRKEGKTK